MEEQLFNQNWFRIADLKIRLKQHTRIHRHTYRGELTYILQDHVTGQFHRFSPETYQVIGLMDGNRTMQQVWEEACEKLGDDMPTQTDVISLISKLYRANVIVADRLPDIKELDMRRREFERKRLIQQFKSPLSIKIPLLDPEKFLRRTMPYVRPIFSVYGLAVWIVVMIAGILSAGVHWQALTSNMADRILAVENILLIGLTYPFVKVFHELGHAYSVKRWGGEVHEIGIMFLVFFPVPYVDATAATAFRNKYQRMLVGAAGILAEVFLASLAMLLWGSVEEGAFRAVLFNIMLISGVSTVFFNGNPLLRFDAYYVLTDILEIPNLAARSNQYIGYLLKRYLFNLTETASPTASKSESAWLFIYSLASFIYRIFITIFITLFVASKYFILGSIIGIWFIYMAIIQPVFKTLMKPMTDPQMKLKKGRIYTITGTVIGLIVIAVFTVPVPLVTNAQGIIWVSEQAQVYSEESGFVEEVRDLADSRVQAGDVVLRLDNPELEFMVKALAAQVKESRARYEANVEDKNLAEVLREDYQYVQSQYERARERLEKLTVKARNSGTLVLHRHENLEDRFVSRGDVLGFIVNYEELPVRAMVAGDDIENVVNNTEEVEVRFVSRPGETYNGTITRITPSASNELLSKVLSVEGGGRIALNPGTDDVLRTYEEYFQFEIDVPDAPKHTTEERVFVRFKHDPEPLARRWYRSVRRVFLRTFSV